MNVTKNNVAIIVVTYKRQTLLQELLKSIGESYVLPAHLVIVDNENSEETKATVSKFATGAGSKIDVHYEGMSHNTGGAGGFNAGARIAYDKGAKWFWFMDDDVAVLPDGLQKLEKWMPLYESIQGQKYDYDDSVFYWQYRFIPSLGIPNPVANSEWNGKRYKPMNTACFEGGLFSRRIVKTIGLPDPRFFIYWDDTIYGYLASKHTRAVMIDDFIMRRTRDIKQVNMGVRHLRGTSNMVRFHIMRNRAYMAKYFALYNDYNPTLYALGTLLTLAKEIIRISTVDRDFKEGIKALYDGLATGRKIHKDDSWGPMPPLD
ncbi:MAG: glycosyltransferase [Bifidobacteriaceae bacterium]|nr:glycosyltransferase [Bifidobacteriaceae bacterium]